MWPVATAFFTQHNVSKVHLCSSMYQNFILFIKYRLFHCANIPHFVYPSICWWTFGLFPIWLLWIVLIRTFVYSFCLGSFCLKVSSSPGYIPRGRIAGSKGMCNILRNRQIVFQSGCTVFRSHPQWKNSNCSTSSPTFVSGRLLYWHVTNMS